MDTATIISIICGGITIISVLVSIYQFKQQKNTKQIRLDDAMALHIKIGQLIFPLQQASRIIDKKTNPTEEDLKIAYSIGLGEGYGQSLLIDTAKVYFSLDRISNNDIDQLIKQGKLSEMYESIYRNLSLPKENRVGLMRRIGIVLKKIW
jgi:hypothetical protein